MTCDARIRPLPNDSEVACEVEHDITPGLGHGGTLRDYAYPGSVTVVEWLEDDRRTFHGAWPGPCSDACSLPSGHRGRHL